MNSPIDLSRIAPLAAGIDRATYDREYRDCVRSYVEGNLTYAEGRSVLQRAATLTDLLALTVGRAEAERACAEVVQRVAAVVLRITEAA